LLKHVDKYILKELIYPFLFGVAAFTLILIGGGILPGLVGKAVKYGVSFFYVIRILFYRLPDIIVYIFPMSMLLSTLIAFGRLSSDGEITAFRSGGVNFVRLMLPALVVGLIVTFLTFFISEFTVPSANIKSRQLEENIKQKTVTAIKENVNLTEYEKGYLKRIIYAKKLENKTMYDVSISEFDKGSFSRAIFAHKAIWKQKNGWIFFDGIMHQFSQENPESVFVIKFSKEEINLTIKPMDLNKKKRKSDEMNFIELSNYINLRKKTGNDTRDLTIKMYQKLAIPFASFLFVLLGAPLGIRPHRSSSTIGLGLSILVVFMYYFITAIGVWLTMIEILSPLTGTWLPNIITVFLGIYLIKRVSN